jgi:cell division protein FtsB
MMVVPFIARMAKKEQLPYKSGKQLCMWNSIIMFVLSAVLLVLTEVNFIGGVGAIIFYFINKWIFVSDLQQQTHPPIVSNVPPKENVPTASPSQPTHICLSAEGELSRTYGNYNVSSSDIMLQENPERPKAVSTQPAFQPNVQPIQAPSSPKQTEKYCSRCGQIIDSSTKKCRGCGKQYFKGFSLKTVFIILLSVLLVASLAGNIILNITCVGLREEAEDLTKTNKSLKSDVRELKDEIDDLNDDISDLKRANNANSNKLDLLDSWIVFIENDGTKYYHKYECNKFVGDDCWAHNIEYAEYIGYKPCPNCYN